MLTPETLKDAMNKLWSYGPPGPPRLFVSLAVKTELDKWARTKTIKKIGNYTLYELDGVRRWSRTKRLHDFVEHRYFPRDGSEGGWTPWYNFNRHWRKRGFPASTSDIGSLGLGRFLAR